MKILVIDDEPNIRRMLRAILEAEGWAVEEAPAAEEALERVGSEPPSGFGTPDAVLLDLALPGMSGLEALPRISDLAPGSPVVMMSGQASLGEAVEATRRGAFHFLEKPFHAELVVSTLRAALEVSRARDLVRLLGGHVGEGNRLIGDSPAMQEVRSRIRRAAPSDARILITGESGTGKELAAEAIHALSGRKGRPFVAVNSAAIPEGLVESELFGHERGAFTGALERRRGRFELAHGGTLFLDEVGDLSPGSQARLLRVLEEGSFERVGGSTAIRVDVRVVAASNRIGPGARPLREDLFHRLNVIPIEMPALRDRMEDLPALVAHAGERIRRDRGLIPPDPGAAAMDAFRRHSWPGNVRELLNVLERLAILHPGESIGAKEVEWALGGAGPTIPPGEGSDRAPSLSDRLDAVEREWISQALSRAGGSMAGAARILGTDRGNLYRRIRRLGIVP